MLEHKVHKIFTIFSLHSTVLKILLWTKRQHESPRSFAYHWNLDLLYQCMVSHRYIQLTITIRICATISGSWHKYHFCWDKSFVATNMCLSWQNYVCLIFVATNVILSRQAYFCRESMVVATELLVSLCYIQLTIIIRVCAVIASSYHKYQIQTKHLSRQKKILVAPPTNGSAQPLPKNPTWNFWAEHP